MPDIEKTIYASPAAELDGGKSTELTKIYSPVQVAFGSFIGGPVGVVYFLWRNFIALKNDELASKTLIIGSLAVLALVCVFPFLPDSVPSMPFTIAYVIIGKMMAENHQLKKQAIEQSDIYSFQSNWSVFGWGLVCIVGTVLVALVPYSLMAFGGVIEL